MNTTNVIFIENGVYPKIKKALKQWIDLYFDELDENLIFKIYKHTDAQIIILLNQQIENDLFFYLINYVTYPENINYNVKVRGYTTLKDEKLFPKEKLHQQIEVYIPANDSSYDIVHVVTKFMVAFEIDFNGNSKKIISNIKYDKPNFKYNSSKAETVKVNRKETTEKVDQKIIKKFNYRYILISGVYLIGVFFYVNIFSATNNSRAIVEVTTFALLLWLIVEFRLLRYRTVYLKLLVLTIVLALFEFYFNNKFEYRGTSTKYTRMGVCFLILYKILRYLYLKVFNKEPEFGRDAEKISDILFTAILLFVTLYVGGIWT